MPTKNSGMVSTWPMPIKRSRVFTRQTMIRGKVAKNEAPSCPSGLSLFGCVGLLRKKMVRQVVEQVFTEIKMQNEKEKTQ